MEAGKARRRAEGRHGWRRWGSEGEGAVKREGEGVWWESGGGGDRRLRRGSGIGFGILLYKANTISSIHPR
jgi:hypothetical protein